MLGAAALIAAALGDFVVERIADTGVFGAGYIDRDQSGVGSVLVLGVGVAFAAVVWRFGALLGSAGAARRAAWHRATARALAPRTLARVLPGAFVIQLAGVYGIESVERLALGAPLPDGVGWLGAPLAFSLTFHLLLGLVCAFALTAALRALLAACAALVVRVLALATALADAPQPCLSARTDTVLAAVREHFARRHGERGPPLLPTIA